MKLRKNIKNVGRFEAIQQLPLQTLSIYDVITQLLIVAVHGL
jgi:hypothetical protein